MGLRERIKELIREVLREELSEEHHKGGIVVATHYPLECFGSIYKTTKDQTKGLVDWDDAPDWAMYHAIDADGESFWSKEEPRIEDGMWIPKEGFGKHYELHKYYNEDEVGDWAESLQKRP